MDVDLETLRPFLLGPFRDRIIEFEGTDWCCRQAALYTHYVLRRLGYRAVVLEGTVSVESRDGSPIMIVHAWVVLPDYNNHVIDLTLTQANWIDQRKPLEPVTPIWGTDPPTVQRSVEKVWSMSTIANLLSSEHWRKPGRSYQEICDELLAFAYDKLRLEEPIC